MPLLFLHFLILYILFKNNFTRAKGIKIKRINMIHFVKSYLMLMSLFPIESSSFTIVLQKTSILVIQIFLFAITLKSKRLLFANHITRSFI